MFKKLVQVMMFVIIAGGISQTAFAQKDKEIEIESLSGNRNRTIEINRSGVYRLSDDITVRDGDGIVINAPNVTLNLNGNVVKTNAPGNGRGIFVNGVRGVSVKNGKVSGFRSNVMIMDAVNVNIESLQIIGGGLAPNNGPTEIGVQIVNSRSVFIVMPQ